MIPGWPVLNPQPRLETLAEPLEPAGIRGATSPGLGQGEPDARLPGSRVAASVPGAYFHLFGLQAPGVDAPSSWPGKAEPGPSARRPRARRGGGGGLRAAEGPGGRGRTPLASECAGLVGTAHGTSSLSITWTC